MVDDAGRKALTQAQDRILRGVGSAVASQGVTVFIQLASVPIFLLAWGPSIYGEWLVLSAAPTYLSFADFGFGSAACNLMAIRLARGDVPGARSAFASALSLSLISILFFSTLLLVIVGLIPRSILLHGINTSNTDARTVLVALGGAALLGMVRTTLYSVLYAEGRYPSGLLFLSLCRLFEFSGASTSAICGLSLGATALCVLGVGTVTTLLYAAYVFGTTKTFRVGLGDWHFAEFKSMAGPSVAFLIFPLSNAINFQGVVIVIGMLFSPVYVVAFTTMRSLSRLAVLPVRTFLDTLRPELSRLYGLDDITALTAFVARTSRLAQWGGLSVVLVSCLFGSEIVKLWTRDVVHLSWFVLGFLMLSAYFQAVYYPWFLTAYASNKHQSIAALSLIQNSLLIFVVLGLGARLVSGPAAAIAVGDFVLGIGCLLVVARLLGEKPRRILFGSFQSPVGDLSAVVIAVGRALSRARLGAQSWN